jgi:hypothetical protein
VPPAPPNGVAVSPTGTYAGDLYVAAGTPGGPVYVVNPTTNTIVDTIATLNDPTSVVAVSPTGTYAGDVYVLNYGNGDASPGSVSVIS